MTPETAENAFDLFSQAERTPDRASGGLGLGLALVKSLVELHRGTVTCKSRGIGRGSRFTVSLPRFFVQNGETGSRMSDGPPYGPSERLRIMVVDDNVDAAAMLALLLETQGHQVLVEHDSTRALQAARAVAPHVCLLDIGLPDMDGYELARRLRAQPETTASVLIAVTGYGQESDRENSLAAGFDHHLIKPVDIKMLYPILRQSSIDPGK